MLGKRTAGSILVRAKMQAGSITDYPSESDQQCKREAAMQMFGREVLQVLATASSKAVMQNTHCWVFKKEQRKYRKM